MAQNSNTEVLLELKKNNRGDSIVVSRITGNNDSKFIDIRQSYTNDEGESILTKKGIRFNSELLPEILDVLVGELEANEVQDLVEKYSDNE